MIGHNEVTYWDGPRERSWWIGKPWRRLEVLRQDHLYKGEVTSTTWDVTLHVALFRRIAFTFSLLRDSWIDYSEVEHQ